MTTVVVEAMYVYMLRAADDPKTLTSARYVGVTENPRRRLRRHLDRWRRGVTPLSEWVRSLGAPPALDVLLITDREHAADEERRAIAGLKKLGAALLNETHGGDGPLTAEGIERRAAGVRRRYAADPELRARMVAMNTDPAKRAHQSGMMRARYRDPAARAAMPEGACGRTGESAAASRWIARRSRCHAAAIMRR